MQTLKLSQYIRLVQIVQVKPLPLVPVRESQIQKNCWCQRMKKGASVQATKSASKESLGSDDAEVWSHNQQVILEWALKQHPKGTEQRWEKIAEHIPGKSKEDCIQRFKYLAELVKQRKMQ